MGIQPTLGNTIGSAFLGCVAAAVLYGITNLQVFLYYQSYPNDWMFQKISVAVLWLLDSFHLALTIQLVYHYLVESFGDLAAQEVVYWSFKLQIAVNIIIVLLVQSLYALRVWKLGRNFSRVWPWIVVLSVVCGYAVGILLAVKTYHIKTWLELSTITWTIYTSFSYSTANDIVIAAAICLYLQKSRSGFSGTNFRIVTIMRYVVISGFLTSACSMACLICLAVMPNTLVFLGVEFLLTKLYINSFIAMLNARNNVREKDTSSAMTVSKLMNVHVTSAVRNDFEASPTSPHSESKHEVLEFEPVESYESKHRYPPSRKYSVSRITVHKSIETRTDAMEDVV